MCVEKSPVSEVLTRREGREGKGRERPAVLFLQHTALYFHHAGPSPVYVLVGPMLTRLGLQSGVICCQGLLLLCAPVMRRKWATPLGPGVLVFLLLGPAGASLLPRSAGALLETHGRRLALPSSLPVATQTPTPASQEALPGSIITLTANFNNQGNALGFSPFYQLYLPAGCYDFISADW